MSKETKKELANLYGVDTKVLNQAVKRNIERFPAHFRFQLTDLEKDKLVTICMLYSRYLDIISPLIQE